MGRGDANNAKRFGDVVAVCDVDAGHAAEASKQFGGAKAYADFRKLLDAEKDVAVVGRSAMMSYGAKIDAFPVVCQKCETTQDGRRMGD